MDTKHDIPHREIGEQDDELLEQLWKQLPDSQEDPFIADQGFKDLQGRIQRKLRIGETRQAKRINREGR